VISNENTGQIEAEPIHMHLLNPVLQAIDQEIRDHRAVTIHRVSTPCVVAVDAPIVRIEVVKTPVAHPLEIDRGSFHATFGRMIEDDIQDDTDPAW